jgi:hypothetical protein
MHIWNSRPNIPLNDCVLSTLWAGVEVSSEPPIVHARRHPVILIWCDVRGLGGQSPVRRSPSTRQETPSHKQECRRWEDQGSGRCPTASSWSRQIEGGMCGSTDTTGPWASSTWQHPSAADRRWWAKQVAGTLHDVWTTRTTHPTSKGCAFGSWAASNAVKHNNSKKY